MPASSRGPTAPPRWAVLAAFAAVYLVWGSTYLAIKFAIATLPPFLMAGTRFTLAGLLLGGWMLARGGAPWPTRREWAAAALLGVLFLACGNGGVVWAEQRVPSGLAAVLVAMVPVWTVLVDWARPGGPRPGVPVVAGLALGFAGVLLLAAPGRIAGAGGIDPVGVLVLACSTFAWSVGTVSAPRLPLPRSPFMTTAMEMLAGGVVLLAAGAASGELGRLDFGAASAKSLLALGYLIVFGSLVAFSAFVWLLGVTTPARVATYAYVNPVVAVLLGWAFAGEPLELRTLIAAAVIVGGVVLITTGRARRAS